MQPCLIPLPTGDQSVVPHSNLTTAGCLLGRFRKSDNYAVVKSNMSRLLMINTIKSFLVDSNIIVKFPAFKKINI